MVLVRVMVLVLLVAALVVVVVVFVVMIQLLLPRFFYGSVRFLVQYCGGCDGAPTLGRPGTCENWDGSFGCRARARHRTLALDIDALGTVTIGQVVDGCTWALTADGLLDGEVQGNSDRRLMEKGGYIMGPVDPEGDLGGLARSLMCPLLCPTYPVGDGKSRARPWLCL